MNPKTLDRRNALICDLEDEKWLNKRPEDFVDMKDTVHKYLMAALIYYLWKLNGKRYLMIIKPDVNCGDEPEEAPKDNDEYEEDDKLYRYMSEDFAKEHRFFMDGKSFYLGMFERS